MLDFISSETASVYAYFIADEEIPAPLNMKFICVVSVMRQNVATFPMPQRH